MPFTDDVVVRILRQFFDSTQDGIFVLGPDLRFRLWNNTLARLTGMPAERVLGLHLFDLFPGMREHVIWPYVQCALAGTPVASLPFFYNLILTGRTGYARIEYYPLFTPEGAPDGIAGIVNDVTLQVESQRKIEDAYALLTAVIHTAPVAIVVLGTDRRVRIWNRAAEDIFGWPASEAIGEQLPFVPSEFKQEHQDLWDLTFSGVHPVGLETIRHRKDGTPIHVSLSSQPILGPAGEVLGYTAIYLDITARKQDEQALRLSEARLERSQRIALMGTYETTFGEWPPKLPATSTVWSPSIFEILGLDPSSATPSTENVLSLVHPDDAKRIRELLARPLEDVPRTTEHRIVRPDGQIRFLRHHFDLDRRADGSVGIIGAVQDITDYRNLEAMLLQSQKLEGIGRLAGGVAHDFNNLLTVINGYADVISRDPALAQALREPIAAVLTAGRRAADLTQQLLAFSRRQVLQPRPIDINASFAELRKMLDRLLGGKIEIIASLDPDLSTVLADPVQIQQVLLNLVVNARDAMPDGGRLSIETRNFKVDNAFAASHPDASPGPYVRISITDTGHGMDEETRVRIFEPFFTTKEMGQGTGLGLAMVYGIVQQSRGFILVESTPGAGATFAVFLPAIDPQARDDSEPGEHRSAAERRATVLIVEDQEPVRRLAATILRQHGHTVLEAANPAEAVQFATSHPGPIHLLLSDVLMPGLSVRELTASVSALRGGIRVLYFSGHAEDVIVKQGILDAGFHLVPKPFSPDELIRHVDLALA